MHNSLYMLKIRRQRAIELRKMNKKAAPTTLISSLRAVSLPSHTRGVVVDWLTINCAVPDIITPFTKTPVEPSNAAKA
jgi:type II secretory pathway component PulL